MTEEKSDTTKPAETTAQQKGKFYDNLARNAASIKRDRAEAISESAEMKYRRRVEDLRLSLRDLQRQREASIDLSPASTIGLELAKGFDADKFVQEDMQRGIEIRNIEIQLEVAMKQYTELFGRAL